VETIMSFSTRAMIAGLMLACAAPAPAQMFWTPPDFRGAAVMGAEPGLSLPLPGATQAELNANLLWNLRAGLNVAALQCQFSPTLRTVKLYNEVIAHHSKELASAFSTMGAYFKRKQGKGGQNALDQYTTRTYNGFSTMHAQLGFCFTAASIARDAIAQPKGELLSVARRRMRELRNSLVPKGDQSMVRSTALLSPLPRLDDACWDKNGRYQERACG
jgi:hypothetical protein